MASKYKKLFQPKSLYTTCVEKIANLTVASKDFELTQLDPYLPYTIMKDVTTACLRGERNLKLLVVKSLGFEYMEFVSFIENDKISLTDMFCECFFNLQQLLDNIPYCFYKPILSMLLLEETIWEEYFHTILNCTDELEIGDWDWSSLTPEQGYAIKYYPDRLPSFCDEYSCIVSSKYTSNGEATFLCGLCCKLQDDSPNHHLIHVTEVTNVHSEDLVRKYFQDETQWCSLCKTQPLFEILFNFNDNLNVCYYRTDIIYTKKCTVKRRKIETRPKKCIPFSTFPL